MSEQSGRKAQTKKSWQKETWRANEPHKHDGCEDTATAKKKRNFFLQEETVKYKQRSAGSEMWDSASVDMSFILMYLQVSKSFIR